MNTLSILNSRKGRAVYQVIKLREPKRMMQLLGDPQNTIDTIVVAGTNGKGSVCCLAAMLDVQRQACRTVYIAPFAALY